MVAFQFYNDRISQYVEWDLPIHEYSFDMREQDLEHSLQLIKDNIQLEWIQKKFWMLEEWTKKFKLLEKIVDNIKHTDVIAFAGAELCWDFDPRFAKRYLNALMEKWWYEFFMHLPAVYDNYTSFGPYQNTSFVINGGKKNGIVKWNVSAVSEYCLPEDLKLPWSMIYLSPEDQHLSAFLNMIYNYAHLIQNLNTRQLESLDKNWSSKRSELVEYVCCAHHTPKYSLRAAKMRLDNNARSDFTVSCSNRIKKYATRSQKYYNHFNK